MMRVIVDRLERTTKSATLLPPTLALLDDEDGMSLLVIARFFSLFCAKKEKRNHSSNHRYRHFCRLVCKSLYSARGHDWSKT